MLRKNKGFTLIELLVVIAIIGILSTIVLINLNTARNKAKDAAIKAALSEVRAAAEIDYDTSSSYINVCSGGTLNTTGDFGKIKINIESNGGTITCQSDIPVFCAQSTLNAGGSWCVDSTGVSGSTAACDATNRNCASD
jgi:prepilin-type N-terminal cleavage/methylation domain-containing protein